MIGVDSTVSLTYMIDMLNDFPPAIVAEELPPRDKMRESTQSLGGYIQLMPELMTYRLVRGSSTTSNVSNRFGDTMQGRGTVDFGDSDHSKVAAPKRDPWLELTSKAIAAHRDLQAGWDGGFAAVPSEDALDVAELLTQSFSVIPMNRRPQFMVDTEGNPSFTMYNDEIYLHLTVDGPNSVSWFRSVGDVEDFDDSVVVTVDNAREFVHRVASI